MSRKILLASVMALGLLGLILVGVLGSAASARRGGMEVRSAELTATGFGQHPDEDDAYGAASAVTDYSHSVTAWGLSVSKLKPDTTYYEINRFDPKGSCDEGKEDEYQWIMMITTDRSGYFKTPLGVVAMAGDDPVVGNYVDICRQEGETLIAILDGEFSKGGSGRSKPRKK